MSSHLMSSQNKAFFHHVHDKDMLCGLCQGKLMNHQEDEESDENSPSSIDLSLSQTSSWSVSPLPSESSAVGQLTPCGHCFHVSCFHNHTRRLQKRKEQQDNLKLRHPHAIVEVCSDGGGVDSMEDSSTAGPTTGDEDSLQKENDKMKECSAKTCPTCNREYLDFVELIDFHHHDVNSNKKEDDITLMQSCDEAQSDITHFFSFGESIDGVEEIMLTDTTNKMERKSPVAATKTSSVKARNSTKILAQIHGHGNAPTIHSIRSNMVFTETKVQNKSSPLKNFETDFGGPQHWSSINNDSMKHRLVHTTPAIKPDTPNSQQRTKATKKVRFFDELAEDAVVESRSPEEDYNTRRKHGGCREQDDSPTAYDKDDSREVLWSVSSLGADEDENQNMVDKNRQLIADLKMELLETKNALSNVQLELDHAHEALGDIRAREGCELDVLTEQSEQINHLKFKLMDIEEQLEASKQDFISKEAEVAVMRLQMETSKSMYESEQESMTQQVTKLQEELATTKIQLEKKIKQLKQDAEQEKDEKESLAQEHNRYREEMTAKCADHETEKAKLEQQLTSIEDDAASTKSVMEQERNKHEEEMKKIQTEKEAFWMEHQEQVDKMAAEFESNLAKVRNELESMLQMKEDLTAQLEQRAFEVKDLQKQLDKLKPTDEESENYFTAEKQELLDKNEQLAFDLQQLKQESEQLKQKVASEKQALLIENEQLVLQQAVIEKRGRGLEKELEVTKDALSTALRDNEKLSSKHREEGSNESDLPVSGMEKSNVQVLREELAETKKDLKKKNTYIKKHLSLAKGKLIEYVRTKEDELENTKQQLDATKQELATKNGSITQNLRETEGELLQLTSLKEQLLKTMTELENKNGEINKQLDDAKEELASLTGTKQELKEKKNELETISMQLKMGYIVFGIFLLSWLVESVKRHLS